MGALNVEISASSSVVGIGEVSFDVADAKRVGFGIAVDAEAQLAGKAIEEGEALGLGAELTFAVSLHNQSAQEIVSGDFDVTLSVLDSSFVALHSAKIDGRGGDASLEFAHTLSSSALPAGDLTFRFEVANAAGVHTVHDVVYQLQLPMVATSILVGGKKPDASLEANVKIGETLAVAMQPATVPDLRTVNTYASKDFSGAEAASRRNFFMDVSAQNSGVALFSVAGVARADGSYAFETTVAPSLDFAGSHVISFRYVSAAGESIALSNWNADAEEMFDESEVLTLSVATALEIVDVSEEPKTDDFFYGNVVAFKFKVKDSISGRYVRAGDAENANVFLTLKHRSGEREFVSSRQAATQQDDSFVISWNVSPNAVAGEGVLALVASDADGNDIKLTRNGANFEKKVRIGGDLDVEHKQYSTGFPDADQGGVVVVKLYLKKTEKKSNLPTF